MTTAYGGAPIEGFRLSTLDNGLRVVSEKLPGVRSIALGFWIGAGSRYESPPDAGISHFIEHLIFKGTRHYSAWDIARTFDEMGAELNAATSKEYTVLHARFLDEQLGTAFAIMAEMVAAPSFADLQQERDVVLEEVAMYEDSPPELIHDVLADTVFAHHPLGRPVIGTAESLRSLTKRRVGGYHKSHYVAPAVVVAAAGNVDHERLVELSAGHLGAAAAAAAPPSAALSEPVRRHAASFTAKDTEQYHVCLGGLGVPRHDPRRFALSIVDTILGGSSSSRLFQEVREKRGLAYSVYSYSSLYAETGLTAIYVGSRPEALSEAMAVIRDELGRLGEGIPEGEIARTKEHLKGQLVLGMESPASHMNRLGRAVLAGIEILPLDGMIAQIEGVTAEEVGAVVRELYDPAGWSAVCIGPEAAPFRAASDGFVWEEP